MVLEWKEFEKELPPLNTDLLFWLVDQKLMRVGRAYYCITDGVVVPIVVGYGQTNDKVYWTELPLPPNRVRLESFWVGMFLTQVGVNRRTAYVLAESSSLSSH